MSNRLGGKQGTAYLGTNANQPPNWTFSDRDPNQYDINNVSIGDMWLNQTDESVFILVSLAGDPDSKGSLATWLSIVNDAQGTINSLRGNTGGKVTGDGNGNIDFIGDGVGIQITGTPGTNTLTASLVGGGEAAQSFPTDNGTAVPAAGVINIKADLAGVNSGSTVSFSAVGNTITFNVTDASDNTIIGNDSGNLTMTGGDNTILGEASGYSLTSGSDNTILGGSAGGNIDTGSSNIIIGSIAGSSLTTSDSFNTLIGDIGFAGAAEFVSITAGANGSSVFHNFPGVNASTTNGGNNFIGSGAGNFTLAGGAGNASNNALGDAALSALTTGYNNQSLGSFSLSKITTGNSNIGIGHDAGFNVGGDTGLVSGTNNVLIGTTAGSAYTAAESSNIILGTVAGTAAESNVLRIGSATGAGAGEINKAFISGIRGITPVSADGIPVFIGSAGQLGTVGTGGTTFVSTATGNSGGAVPPAAGNIFIIGDGTTATVVGSPGSNTLTISAIGGGGGTLTVLAGDTGSAAPAAGTINIITDNASQVAGATVLFSGATDTLTLGVSDADDNTLIGNASGNGTLSGIKNTAFGVLSCTGVTTGSNNSMLGYGSGNAFTTGSYNTFMGYLSGSAYTTSESSNISINSVGIIAESNVLRIGSATGTGNTEINKAFISGIRGITPASADGIPVFIGSAGQLGTVGNGGTTMVQTLTANSGGAVGPASGNINIVGDGITVTIVGSPGTNTLTVTALGGGGGGGASVFNADSGSAIEAAGIISIKTNNASLGAGSTVLFSGSSNALQLDVTDNNNNTLIGFNTGNLTLTGTYNTALGLGCGAALTTGSSNILLGREAGSLITTGSGNFICGNGNTVATLKGATTSSGFYGFGANGSVFLHNYGGFSSGNTFVGYSSAGNFNVGQNSSSRNNTGCGDSTLSLLTTGINNVALGALAGTSITSGNSNTLIGTAAGSSYASSESNNICLGRSTNGTVTESNVLRIGAGTGTGTGQVNKAFVSGIRGITTGISNAIPVLIDSAGQLGTAGGSSVITTLTGNSGGPVSATAGNITVKGDGTTVTVSGSPGTSTLTISTTGSGTTGPAFFAYLNTTVTNVTGDTTVYQIIYDTEPYDFGSNFNLGTSVFTAPTTGVYNFTCGVFCEGNDFNGSNQNPATVKLTTSTNIFSLVVNAPVTSGVSGASLKYGQVGTNVYTNMTAGDTAFVTIKSGTNPLGNKSVQVDGTTTGPYTGQIFTGIFNFFSGALVR